MVARTWGSRVGSISFIELKSDAGKYLSGATLSISTESVEDGYGETITRNVDKGNYYISVISGIEWEVKVYELK